MYGKRLKEQNKQTEKRHTVAAKRHKIILCNPSITKYDGKCS